MLIKITQLMTKNSSAQLQLFTK